MQGNNEQKVVQSSLWQADHPKVPSATSSSSSPRIMMGSSS